MKLEQLGSRQQRLVAKHLDQMFVSLRDGARIAIEVEQAHGEYISRRAPQADIPVNLILQAIPGKSDDRHSVLANQLHVMPLSPKPARRLSRIGTVGFSVHDRPVVT